MPFGRLRGRQPTKHFINVDCSLDSALLTTVPLERGLVLGGGGVLGRLRQFAPALYVDLGAKLQSFGHEVLLDFLQTELQLVLDGVAAVSRLDEAQLSSLLLHLLNI